jgi:hypothetical protein
MKTYIGIDNGVTGSIGVISGSDYLFERTPTIKQQSYTKTKKNISRIDFFILKIFFENRMSLLHENLVLIERPMVNPTRFSATLSAMRALESTLICLEELNLPYQYIDSKEWQKALLPKGCKGTAELKQASRDIGRRLFPKLNIKDREDADGILIAEYARRNKL